jgi:hypothetical protein
MSVEEDDPDDGPEGGGEDLPDEDEVPASQRDRPRAAPDDDDEDDGSPLTHLTDAAYDEFVASEFDAQGRRKGDPPVVPILLGLIVVILLVWFLLSL